MKNVTMFFGYLFLLVFFFSRSAEAQLKEQLDVFLHPKKFYEKYLPNLKPKRSNLDTLFIKQYPNYLTVGSHLIIPDINININPVNTLEGASQASSHLRTNVGSILAFSASYRFITAGFAVVVSPDRKDNDDYAHTSYRTATIRYNAEAYYLQFKFIRTRGYTDVNTFNSDSLSRYTKREDMLVKEYQFEGLYNFSWKKYSYYAPIDYTFRQLKTRGGMMLKAGAYYNQILADSNILTNQQRAYFHGFEGIREIRTTSIKLAPGIGANIVFLRRFYGAFAVFTPYNLCVYSYYKKDDDRVSKGMSLAFVLDANVCLGYQSERLYAGLRYQFDSKNVRMVNVDMVSLFSYFGIDLGYRFEAPSIVKKVYKNTMPPGM